MMQITPRVLRVKRDVQHLEGFITQPGPIFELLAYQMDHREQSQASLYKGIWRSDLTL